MKILKTIGIIIALLVVVLILLGIIAPKSFEVHRDITINATEDVVWKGISTFEQFNKWNPWNKTDSTQVVKDEGQDGTVGAVHSWKGKKAGEGSMTVTKLEPNKLVEYDLHFIKPFEAHNIVDMQMDKTDGGYKVTWIMKGPLAFPMNIFSLFMSMDKMIGKDFEHGLADLKKLCESTSVYKVNEVDWTEKNCLAIRQIVDIKDLSNFFATNYGKISTAFEKAGTKMAGAPLGIYYMFDMKTMKTDVAAALPYDTKKKFDKEFVEITLPATKAYSVDYYGPYTQMKPAYNAIAAKFKESGQDVPKMSVEEYITDPMSEKDSTKWLTRIYYFANK